MFFQHLLYLKTVHCCIPSTSSPLDQYVYGLYDCENVDICEQALTDL